MPENEQTAHWPRLFTCPITKEDVERDDLGEIMVNPTFSDKDKMIMNLFEGCLDCDMRDTCLGPVPYVPATRPPCIIVKREFRGESLSKEMPHDIEQLILDSDSPQPNKEGKYVLTITWEASDD